MQKRPPANQLYLVLLTLLSSGTAAAGVAIFLWIVLRDGLGIIEVLLVPLFAILYFWIATGFWTATFGFIREWRAQKHEVTRTESYHRPLPRTAIVMPIYNENAVDVHSAVAAMYVDLTCTGKGEFFDFFILSDTTDPDVWLEEEAAWASLRATLKGRAGIYYRRREHNSARKSGNIRDFCERWGRDYRYMLVLDADSLLKGRTMIEMVQRMEADQMIGILQSPPVPINRHSLFARLQQ